MNPVAIIGAGITGLTAAFHLKRKGVPVTVYEAGARAGGVIQSIRKDGYLAEFGPNTILETSPKITQLVRDLGIGSRRLETDPKANARYLVRKKKPIAMPSGPLGFLSTPLFSTKAKLAVMREPFVPRRTDGVEESVADFVVRRLNQEFLDHAIDPLVAGIYAGDPHKLSLKHAFPKLAEAEARDGSLIKAQLFGGKERKERGEIAKDRAPKFSFDEGLQVLIDALAKQLGDSLRLNTSVERLTQRIPSGWRLELLANKTYAPVEHSMVVYAGTAFNLGKLRFESQLPFNIAPLAEIQYPPVSSVVLGFRREDVKHPCNGFGMLIPKVEGFRILGTIFSSSLFPNRAPSGHLTLTSYIGGERDPRIASRPAEELYQIVQEDLRMLLGVGGRPTFRQHTFYPKAIPQYNLGYGRYLELMRQIEVNAYGLFLAGNYRDGISLSNAILSGSDAADRVEKLLKTAGAALNR